MQNVSRNSIRIILFIVLLFVAAVLHKANAEGGALPTDPFQRTAVKALRGDYGKLEAWQRTGYARGLKQGVKCNSRVFLTAYYPDEGRDSQIDRRGRRCSMRTAAANKVAENSFIWTRFGLRQARDCGAHSNDRIARGKKAHFWADYWYPNRHSVPFLKSNKIWNKGVHAAAVIK